MYWVKQWTILSFHIHLHPWSCYRLMTSCVDFNKVLLYTHTNLIPSHSRFYLRKGERGYRRIIQLTVVFRTLHKAGLRKVNSLLNPFQHMWVYPSNDEASWVADTYIGNLNEPIDYLVLAELDKRWQIKIYPIWIQSVGKFYFPPIFETRNFKFSANLLSEVWERERLPSDPVSFQSLNLAAKPYARKVQEGERDQEEEMNKSVDSASVQRISEVFVWNLNRFLTDLLSSSRTLLFCKISS